MAFENNELFDAEFYLATNSDVAKAIAEGSLQSPIQHFNDFGRFEKRDPSLLFNNKFYLDSNSDVGSEVTSGKVDHALKHFTRRGQYEQRDRYFHTRRSS